MTGINRVVVHWTCALATLCCAQAARAQSADPQPGAATQQPAVEVTPFVGWGSEGSARTGAAVAFALTPKVSLESEVAYHPRALFSSSVNIVYALPHLKAVEPYVTAGIGLGQFDSAIQAPTPTGFLVQRSVGLVVNAGTGIRRAGARKRRLSLRCPMVESLGIQPESFRIYHGATFGVGK